MSPLCIVELHITFDNTKLLSIIQQCCLWRIYVAGSAKAFFGVHEKLSVFSCDFNRVFVFVTGFNKSLKYQISWKSFQWELS